MKKSLLNIALFTVLTFIFSVNVSAQTKAKTQVKLPVFMASESQIVDKPVNGDLMVAGSQVKITSNISGDVYAAGGQVDITGTVGGNLVVVGGNINVSGKVTKNIITAGGQIKLSDTAELGGYLLAGGGSVDLNGRFSGPVKIGAGTLSVGDKAVINGDLEADINKSDISQTSKILGEKKIQIHETKKVEKETLPTPSFKYFNYPREVFSFLSKLLILLVLVKLFAKKIIESNTKRSLWSNLGLGLIVLVVTPFLSLMLLISVVGIPLSGIIFSLYLIIISLSKVIASILFGEYISKKAYLKTKNQYLLASVALLLLSIAGMIPIAGILVKLFLLLFGLGALSWSLRSALSKK
jgi:hypothetical protein